MWVSRRLRYGRRAKECRTHPATVDNCATADIPVPYSVISWTSDVQNRSPLFSDWTLGRLVVNAFGLSEEEGAAKSLAWVVMPDHFIRSSNCRTAVVNPACTEPQAHRMHRFCRRSPADRRQAGHPGLRRKRTDNGRGRNYCSSIRITSSVTSSSWRTIW